MKRIVAVRVRDVMNATPVTVAIDTSIADLVRLFETHDYHVVPVVAEGHVLVGVVGKVDVLKLLRADGPVAALRVGDLVHQDVGSIMRPQPTTIEPIAEAGEALTRMASEHLPSLPVVTRMSGRPVLVGMVSRSDLRGVREPGVSAHTRRPRTGRRVPVTR